MTQIRQLESWGEIIGTAVKIGADVYGSGGGGGNVAKQFTASVANGKTYMQNEANAYKATAEQYGLDPVQLARAEYDLGRKLTTQELQILSGQPVTVSPPSPVTTGVGTSYPQTTQYGQQLQTEQQAQQAPANTLSKLLPWAIGGGLLYKFIL